MFKKLFENITLWFNIMRTIYIYPKDSKLDNIFKVINDYDILDIKYPILKLIDEGDEYEVEVLDKPTSDNIYAYILVGDPDSQQKYMIRFWNANKYYAWLSCGTIWYYPNYLDKDSPNYTIYKWEWRMPHKKNMYKFAKKIKECLEKKAK